MSTHRNTWKQRERDVAAYFGSERTPLSGGNSKHTRSDTLSTCFYVEVKYRQHHAAVELFLDTAKKAALEKKLPVVVLAEKGKPGFYILTSEKFFPLVATQLSRIKAIRTWANRGKDA